jgi:hypothetical protein
MTIKTLSIGTEITANSRGQIITGKVEKINRTTCLITVTGGNTRFKIGGKVKCPFSIITVPFKCGDRGIELTADVASGNGGQPMPKAPLSVDKWWIMANANLLVLLGRVFNDLSPENLTCDGEASVAWVQKRRREINARYTSICNLIGYDLEEAEYYEIMDKWYQDISDALKQDSENVIQWHKPRTASV